MTASITTAVVVGVFGVVCWSIPARVPELFWAAVPVIAIAVIAGLDLLTSDASPTGQMFFLWPVLYAAAFLRRTLVYAVLALVAVAESTVVFSLEPVARAASDTAGLMTALTLATVIIVTLRQRVNDLLAVLETEAMADPLTGLPNRRAFGRDLVRSVARARRGGQPLSLVTFDVDYFKAINDTWGHATGDLALQTVANATRAVCRESDLSARLGGDEFVLLLQSDQDGALRVAAALRDAVANTSELPEGPPTLSIGVATFPDDADTAESLAAASDAALYEAKAAGRNRIAVAREGRRGAPTRR